MHRLTWQNTWKVHLWMRVPGHITRAAFAKPGLPSETAMAGGSIFAMNAAQAPEPSLVARCQASMCSLVQAMSTTSPETQIPSRNTTSCTSPVQEGRGHIPQNFAAFLLNVLDERPKSSWRRLEKSQRRKTACSLADLSMRCVVDAPQLLQRHLCAPELVLPLRFIAAPQAPHFGLFICSPRSR